MYGLGVRICSPFACWYCLLGGTPGRTRTCDLLLRRPIPPVLARPAGCRLVLKCRVRMQYSGISVRSRDGAS